MSHVHTHTHTLLCVNELNAQIAHTTDHCDMRSRSPKLGFGLTHLVTGERMITCFHVCTVYYDYK
jgi:hypothetical protein